MPRLTQQQIDSIPKLYNSGLSTYKIAEICWVNNRTIWNHSKKLWVISRAPWGWFRKKKSIFNEEELYKISNLYKEGLSSTKIWIIFWKSPCTIIKALKYKGIEIKTNTHYSHNKTKLNILIRTTIEVRKWKKDILKRDDYTCTSCNKRWWNLEVDHIIPLSQIIELNKITKENYMEKINIFLDTNNWRTLCVPCHKKTPTHGWKSRLKNNTPQ